MQEGGFLPALLAPILGTVIPPCAKKRVGLFTQQMNKFIQKIGVLKFNTRVCAPVEKDATAMARLEKDMGGLLENPILKLTEKDKAV